MNGQALARAAAVRLMIFDVDGVLTDGSLYFSSEGDAIKAFNSRDGHGMKMLAESGVRMAILSGRRSRALELRARNLGIETVYQGIDDKRAAFVELAAALGVPPENCGFMGDDVVDLPVLLRCGFAATVADAPEIVRERVHYIARHAGGHGAAREVCELIMRSQGTLERALARYLE